MREESLSWSSGNRSAAAQDKDGTHHIRLADFRRTAIVISSLNFEVPSNGRHARHRKRDYGGVQSIAGPKR
jgi:hypothetical protein